MVGYMGRIGKQERAYESARNRSILSFRASAGTYDIKGTTDKSKLENQFEQVFNDATAAITMFIADNSDADLFYPDESKMEHDPDRLLFLMALIHNNKKDEALAVIREARKNKHRCIFQSGMFSDSYTYIRRWCNREQATIRIRNVFASIFNNIAQIRAYALMALGRNNKKDALPSVYDIRLLDGKYPMGIMQNGRKMLEKQDYNQQQYTEEPSFGKKLSKN